MSYKSVPETRASKWYGTALCGKPENEFVLVVVNPRNIR